MRRSGEPEERAQFSVAELLARYGEPIPATGRRRRRAPDDTDSVVDTVAQPAITQPTTEPSRTARPDSGSVPLNTAGLPSRHGSLQRYSSPSYLDGPGGGQWTPAVGTPTVGTSAVRASAVGQSSLFVGRRPLTAAVLSDDSATVQFPQLGPVSPHPTPWSGRLAGGGEPPAGLGTATRAIPAQKMNDRRVDEPAGQAWDATEEPYDDEPDAPEYGSPVREWALMVAQIGIGIVGGAALWLVCEWLWQWMPVVALVVALAVITGLVWVVRRVRRAEDLQTTVIAVLVGLFVTVSPAALLLVGGQ